QHPLRNENLGDDLRKSQALEASLGKDQGVVTFFTQLAQTGFDIATNVYDTQVRPPVQHLRAAAQAAGGHGGAGSEAVEIGIAVGDEDVADRAALGHCRQEETFHRHGGQILEAVNGQGDAPVQQSALKFLGENALAAD